MTFALRLGGLLCVGMCLFLQMGRAAAAQPDADLYTPNLVDIGERRLHLACTGRGSPTVVFQQGGEGSIANWRKVQPEISAMTRTCFYDRAGFGFSDPPAGAVTGLSETDDLRALLHKAGMELPVVFVGHSIGGFYATLYADRFPSEVAGMVLVDPGFAGQFLLNEEQWKVWWGHNSRAVETFLERCTALAREGKLTAADPQQCFRIEPELTPEQLKYHLHARTRPHWYEAELSQSNNYFPTPDTAPDSVSWRQGREARRSLGDMPLIVLTKPTCNRGPWKDDIVDQLICDQWRAGHAALAARSSRGEARIVPNSDHFVQLSQPAAVIEAIKTVVEQVRERERP